MTENGAPKRMTVSRLAEMLASKTSTARPSVTLTRNAKGETQIEVNCPADTIEDAERLARETYARLCVEYPHSEWNEGTTYRSGAPTATVRGGKA